MKETPVWHPFTQSALAHDPVMIDRAEGAVLYSREGRAIIDAVSSWWVNIHGHSNPVIAEALAKQAHSLEHVIFAGFTHEPAQRLAASLLEVCPVGYHKVFFSDNGSTAVEVAIKMALQYYHNQGANTRKKVIAFEGAYHGDTFGAMSVGSRSAFNQPFDDKLFQVDFIPVPTDDNAEELFERFEAMCAGGEVAAFMFEPLLQGTAGMVMYKSEHLQQLRDIAKGYDVLCIADEVMTGFGRTGHLFATQTLTPSADILCLSKGITGGFMPLGVTLSSKKVHEAFHSNDRMKTFFHGHSYTGNPLACAAANASLELLLSETCRRNIERVSAFMMQLKDKVAAMPGVSGARTLGTVFACELQSHANDYFSSIRDYIYDFAMDRDVLLRPLGNTIYLMPPYVISDAELLKLEEVITELIQTLNQNKK